MPPRRNVVMAPGEYDVLLEQVRFEANDTYKTLCYFDMFDVHVRESLFYTIPVESVSGPSYIKRALDEINDSNLYKAIFIDKIKIVDTTIPLHVSCYATRTKKGYTLYRVKFSPRTENQVAVLPSAEPSIENMMLQMPEDVLQESVRGLLPPKTQ
jgi:hypothetical protein